MIKKLRRKFVLINMLLVSLVLVIVFGIFCFSTYRGIVERSEEALRFALSNDKPQFTHRFDIDRKGAPPLANAETLRSVPVFCAVTDESGNISLINSEAVEVSDELLNEAVKTASGTDGVISELNLRYMSRRTPDGTKYAFADIGVESSEMLETAVKSLCVGAVGLIAFFFISLFLSWLAVKPVEAAWQRQKQFVADASHELKTPLTVILANTDILLSHRSDSVGSQSKWVENTKAEAVRMKKLVDDMLFLAKADAQKPPAKEREINLSDVAESAVLPFEAVIYEGGKTLESDISPDIFITADESEIKQLFAILLDNACKYSPVGSKVTVRLFSERDKALLTVNNSSEVITETDKLFERFYRADFSRTQGGCGLGLSIAKSIADRHRAKISVYSTEKEGTTFKVLFPLKQR